ncbi:cytidine deaminase [Anaerosacchariphilus polymeriproducens]|uniref:Cytidine deaminase n=1 Tax=Anaerosacchariphilus polymeriproducens TaxID=1812858 RepID=A0A371ATU4_9FIRM|nr:cytidine deaminase [Anaerosacchariphilus polymeriproducens]RDU22987.1 cytidine deaminase [Anaerosacchariphilus polymeriproducens]
MINDRELIKNALEAQKQSYSPYSNFSVGAALLTESNKIFKGCNVENAAFTPTNCAERTAFFKAISEGERKFKAIAIVGGRLGEKKKVAEEFCSPCGVCLQVMIEFCDKETFEIIVAKNVQEYESYKLKDLLPVSFGEKFLK